MIRRPPRSTRTDTLFPYTTLFRSLRIMTLRPDWSTEDAAAWGERWLESLGLQGAAGFLRYCDGAGEEHLAMERKICCLVYKRHDGFLCETCPKIPLDERLARLSRSEERRVGKEFVLRGRNGWWPKM